jgi:hypothetical protein
MFTLDGQTRKDVRRRLRREQLEAALGVSDAPHREELYPFVAELAEDDAPERLAAPVKHRSPGNRQ